MGWHVPQLDQLIIATRGSESGFPVEARAAYPVAVAYKRTGKLAPRQCPDLDAHTGGWGWGREEPWGAKYSGGLERWTSYYIFHNQTTYLACFVIGTGDEVLAVFGEVYRPHSPGVPLKSHRLPFPDIIIIKTSQNRATKRWRKALLSYCEEIRKINHRNSRAWDPQSHGAVLGCGSQ